ncbi:RRM_6 domain-containing protein [Cephalotus follicularis]|uniref:RRM_6 domain-containing protein n=1 Tax=Cephalotus follicularis TaxID=3775 RepID=A0A1Q3CS31_CEPFO|nr:RRM_6 domain-containing protein [Cephalotus follicularis]
MYGSRGAMLGSGGVSDGYEVGSKRQRMMESNPYFAVGSGTSGFQPYSYGGGFRRPPFPVVRLRGLPFNCTDIDIFKFFAGLDIVDVLLVNKHGRFSGEAFVVFASFMQVEFALQKDRQNLGRRYVEVFRCNRQDYHNAVAAEVNYEGIYDNDYHGSPPASQAKRFNDKDQMEYTEILKMRGLPFSVKKTEILEFFKEFKVVEDRVHLACRPDGKATGEAYVEFVSADEAKRAMCKDKMTIGSRYVELFPSTSDEARRAESRSRQ